MASKVAEAFIAVRVLASNLRAQMGRVKQTFVRGLQSMRASSQTILGGGGLFSLPTLIGGAAVIKGIKTFANFEQTMARVDAVVGQGSESFERLKNKAKELGRTTEFSASQAAEAMANFAVAGFKTDEIIGAMPDTLNLASAGQVQVGEAAGIVSNIMRGMGLQAKDLGNAVNVLTRAFTNANTDLSQLGLAFRQVGPVGVAAGKDITELTAALQIMNNAGIVGAQSGVMLRNVLSRLASKPADVKRALKTLNVSIEDSNGKMLHMSVILDRVNKAMAGMSPIQRQAIITQIAGLRSMAAFSAMLQAGGQQLRDFQANLKNGADAQDIAARQLDTLTGQWKLFMSAVEGVVIEVGENLTPTLRQLTKGLTDVASAMGDVTPAQREFMKGTAQVGGGVLAWVSALFVAKTATRLLMFGVRGLLSPLGLLLAAIVLVTRVLSKDWNETWSNLGKIAKASLSFIITIFTNMRLSAEIAWTAIKIIGKAAFEAIAVSVVALAAVVVAAGNSMFAAMEAVVENIIAAWKRSKRFFTAFFEAIGAAVEAALDFEDPSKAFKKKFREVMDSMEKDKGNFKNIGDAMARGWREGFDSVFKHAPDTGIDKDIGDLKRLTDKFGEARRKQAKELDDIIKKRDDKARKQAEGEKPKPGAGEGGIGTSVPVKFETSSFVQMWKKVQDSIGGGASIKELNQKQVMELAKVNKNLGEANRNLKKIADKKDNGARAG